MDRLTEADLARMRAEHVRSDYTWSFGVLLNGACLACECVWPCAAARLLAELDWRKANPPNWQGRRHQSPVPHLAQFSPGAWAGQPVTGAQHARWMAEHDAGVQAGILGPVTSEELPSVG